jgi:hypothetical protein
MPRRENDGVSAMTKAAVHRRADAEALIRGEGDARSPKHSRGAAFLAGYAIACKLKAIAMEVHSARTLQDLVAKWRVDDRDVYTHGLEAMIDRLPLRDRFRESAVWRDFAGQVNRWRVSWRYDPRQLSSDEVSTFMDAVNRVYKWIEGNS